MTRYTAVALYVGTIASLCALAGRRWSEARPHDASAGFQIQAARAPRRDSLAALLDSAEELTVSNDPFRLANAPAAVRYDPANDGAIGAAPAFVPPPLRPNMTLKAIVGGPPWQAIIDGLPGQPLGTIARTGSTFDKLTVRAVTRDSVIVQGSDTSWVLSFRRRP